jgi:hypothetical protein
VGNVVYAQLYLRPSAALDVPPAHLAALTDSLRPSYAATRFLLGPDASAMAERVEHTPVPAGGYEANPLLSVPELVDEVASDLKLERDAAAAFLQVLTLAEPTVRNLAVWNGWQPKRVAAVLDGLAERGLLVRGTRPRAGRGVFLPGVWQELSAPNLPIEAWKLALYDDAPLGGRVLPLKPLHELFLTAWRRVQSGDRPAFAPVQPTTGGRR